MKPERNASHTLVAQVLRVSLLIVLATVTFSIGASAQQIVGTSGNWPESRAVLWKDGVMTDLGTLGGTFGQALGINAAGQVVGSSTTADGAEHAFLWSEGAGMSDLGTLPGFPKSVATAINVSGKVVGYASDGAGGSHAFLWDQVVGMTDLGTLFGFTTAAVAIDALGKVVGGSNIDGQGSGSHAFIWQAGVGMTDLGTFGGPYSYAWGINGSTQVVGQADNLMHYGDTKASLWQNGTITDLGSLGGYYPWSIARGINDQGQVVGASNLPTGESGAFLWQGGAMTSLGNLGGAYSEAYAINASGQVVGASATAGGNVHAFVWIAGVMTDLGGGSSYSRALAIADALVPTYLAIIGTPQYTQGPPAPYTYNVNRQILDQNHNPLNGVRYVTESYSPNPPNGNCTSFPIQTGDANSDAYGIFGPDLYYLTAGAPNPCSSSSVQHFKVDGRDVSPDYNVTWQYSGVTVTPR